MFLFKSITWYQVIMFFVVLGGLILLNELARASKRFSLLLFVVVPIILTIFVWPYTATPESSVGTWWHWAKLYSVLAGCLGFMIIRFVKGADKNKYLMAFPPLILAINILEAVIRDFQCYNLNGIVNGVMMVAGPWHIMNGIAGILNIITISGWVGIFIGNDKKKDMLWPDQLWFWIIAYDLWNFAYGYNCVSNHSFYASLGLLLACTIPAFFIKKGAWLQHRTQTLGIWMMFVMALPAFVDTSIFAVKSTDSPTALFVVSALALASNIAVLIYHFYRVFKFKRNPITMEVYSDLKAYKLIIDENKVDSKNKFAKRVQITEEQNL